MSRLIKYLKVLESKLLVQQLTKNFRGEKHGKQKRSKETNKTAQHTRK